MYSLRIEAQQRSAHPPGGDGEEERPEEEEERLEADLAARGCIEFSVGNPRVEHITGVVHLYRDFPAAPAPPAQQQQGGQAQGSHGAGPGGARAPEAAPPPPPRPSTLPVSRAWGSRGAGAARRGTCCAHPCHSTLRHCVEGAWLRAPPSLMRPPHACPAPAQEGRSPTLCCLAIPADMSMADFCNFCGAYLGAIRSMRVLRREARQQVVCMVLIRFGDQQQADDFYRHFNLRAVRVRHTVCA